MAFDFCPKIELSHPLCKGLDLKTHVLKQGKSFYLEPSAHMQEPFFVLNSNKNKTCDYATIAEFLKGVDNSEIIQVPAKGQGVASEKNWHPAMKEEFNKIVASAHNITNKIREEEKRVDYDQQ